MRIIGVAVTLALCTAAHGQLNITAKATLDSLKIEEGVPRKTGESTTDVYFRFKGLPSKFYHSLSGNRLTIDFYDASLPMRNFEPYLPPPLKLLKVTEEKVDAEKAEGLTNDLRDVVRVEVEFDKKLGWDYTVTGQAELITLSTVWKKGGKVVAVEDRPKSRFWIYLLVGAVVVGGAVVVYTVANNSPNDDGNAGLYK